MSLSNEPDKLVNMALDTLSQALKIECCWIQILNDHKNRQLLLASERGFNPKMRQELAAMDMTHSFIEQTIGLGQKIVIPDLHKDGINGLSSFETSGFKWLVAAPLMTYRVNGILGIASRNRRLLKKETAELVMVIASLIANALSKANLSLRSSAMEKPVKKSAGAGGKSPEISEKSNKVSQDVTEHDISPGKPAVKPPDATFHSHTHRMQTFRRSHR